MINKMYPIQLWITTLIIALIIMVIISYSGIAEFSFLFVVLIFSIFFSLPLILLNYFLFKLLSQKFHSTILIKLLLTFITIGIIITFKIISGSMADDFTFIYSTAIIIASQFFKVYHKEVR